MRYVYSSFACAVLGGIAAWLLEALEGDKIKSTEHMDFGVVMPIMTGMLFFFLYWIAFWPLTLLVERFAARWYAYAAAYVPLGAFLGWRDFHASYTPHLAEEYGLRIETAIALFAAAAALLAALQPWLRRRAEALRG